jgi:uncharacterized protein (TIGR01440 family)
MGGSDQIIQASRALAQEIFTAAAPRPSELLVLGGSSSEVRGARIGSAGSLDIGLAVVAAFVRRSAETGVFLAVQGCEHINRALVVEQACAEYYRLEPVNVVPRLKAGGGFATAAYQLMTQPVMVESVQAHAGVDIGETLIGMHLKPVAVPLRLGIRSLGAARVNAAKTRMKLIGGSRAQYLL